MLKSFHKHTGKDSRFYMTPDLTPTQRLEDKKLHNELRMIKDNGEQGLMIRRGRQSGIPLRANLGKAVELRSSFTCNEGTIVFRIYKITQKHEAQIPFQA